MESACEKTDKTLLEETRSSVTHLQFINTMYV